MKNFWLNTVFFILCFTYQICANSAQEHLTIIDSTHGERTIIYEKRGPYAVVEGDILIRKSSSQSGAYSDQLRAAIVLNMNGSRWNNKMIPFELNEELPFANKLAVLQAIDAWQRNTNVQFVEITSKNRPQYPDYLLFTPTQGTACSSFVGKQGGMQVILLAPRCNTMNTAHEIGHALGLWHEQSRIDRDAYIDIIWENIDERYRYNFEQHLNDGEDFGEYDYDSIMHYNAYAFSKNGKKTIIPRQLDVEIGQRDHLSKKDIAAVNAMYASSGQSN